MKKVLLMLFIIHLVQLQYYGPNLFYSPDEDIQYPQEKYQKIDRFVADALNRTNISPSNQKFKNKVKGTIWGYKGRSFINLPVRLRNKKCTVPLEVIFQVNTGSQYSYLSQSVLTKLYNQCQIPQLIGYQYIYINEKIIDIIQSNSYFGKSNVIGYDYLRQNNVDLEVDYKEGTVLLQFNAFSQKQRQDIEEQGEL